MPWKKRSLPFPSARCTHSGLPITFAKSTSSLCDTKCMSKKNGLEIDSCAAMSASSSTSSPSGDVTWQIRPSCKYGIDASRLRDGEAEVSGGIEPDLDARERLAGRHAREH